MSRSMRRVNYEYSNEVQRTRRPGPPISRSPSAAGRSQLKVGHLQLRMRHGACCTAGLALVQRLFWGHELSIHHPGQNSNLVTACLSAADLLPHLRPIHAQCHVWTAPAVQEEFDVSAMVGCGHVFGLSLQPLWPLAMM